MTPECFEQSSITREQFQLYMFNFSPSIDSDDEFIELIRNLVGLTGDKNPPPPEYLAARGTNSSAPIAKQSHGNYIAWNQEESSLEKATAAKSLGNYTRKVRKILNIRNINNLKLFISGSVTSS